MIEIKDVISNVNIYGLAESIKASKYPFAVNTEDCTSEIVERTKILGSCQGGQGHDTFLHGIVVQFDLTFTNKAWVEGERYHFLEFVSSQSTMHRIGKFNPEVQCIEYTDPIIVARFKELVDIYNGNPTDENFLRLIYSIPSGFKLTARMTTNYAQLKTIYHQRKHHRLPEWKAVCRWIETLPEFYTLCLENIRSEEDDVEK